MVKINVLRDLTSWDSAKVLACEQNMERTMRELNATEWHDHAKQWKTLFQHGTCWGSFDYFQRFRAVKYSEKYTYCS